MGEGGMRIFLGKMIISGNIKCLTGLHIGGSQDSMQIGGLSSPVMRDPITKYPFIPGSSLKGKMRSILERYGKRGKNGEKENLQFNRQIGTASNPVYIHCCDSTEEALDCEVCRVFGSSAKAESKGIPKGEHFPARLLVRDCLLQNPEYLQDESLVIITETKYENSLDRITAAANPRQVERVPAGSKFEFELIYDVEKLKISEASEEIIDTKQVMTDLENIFSTMELIEASALGGLGSRGSGKVRFDINDFIGRKAVYYLNGADKDAEKCLPKKEPPYTVQECKNRVKEIVTIFNGE